MTVVKGLSVEEVMKRGSIKEMDVARFRRAVQERPLATRTDAETLLAVNLGCPVRDPSWSPALIGAVTDYLVNHEPPEGYITAQNAGWLIHHIASGGRIHTRTELDLLISVIEKARWTPESLCVLALAQVRLAVATGEGPLRAGSAPMPGRILAGEVHLVRRVLLAFAGTGSMPVTMKEIEVLLDIEDILIDDHAEPAWTDLFVKALANALLSESGYKAPSRTSALRVTSTDRQEAGVNVGGIQRLVCTSLGDVWGDYRIQSREERAIERLELRRLEIITSEDIRPLGSDWLSSRMALQGRITPAQRALIEFFQVQSANRDAALRDVLDRLSAAA